jgi:ankyrin repeat domain-containing protein 50
MDGLSAATTVISAWQTVCQVIDYIKSVKEAGESREKVLLELIRTRALLLSLKDVVEEVKDEEWSRAIDGLAAPDGALSTFKALLEEIMDVIGVERLPREASQTRKSDFLVARLKPLVQDLKWPFKQPEIKGILTTIERTKTHILVALSSDNIRLSKMIREQLLKVHDEVLVVKDDTTAIRQHQDGSKEWTPEQKLIFKSISILKLPANTGPDEVAIFRQGARELLENDIFKQWLTDGNSLLLTGRPGTGKTSICKVVADYLQSAKRKSETFVATIHFSMIDQNGVQGLQDMLGLIVKNMLQARPEVQKHYNRLMLTGEGPLTVTDCLRIIHRARQDFQHFYVVIDALDECDDERAREIVERLTTLRAPLKIFATSRHSVNMTGLIHHFDHSLSLEELLSDGMKVVIRMTLMQKLSVAMIKFLKNDPAEIDAIANEVCERSNGLYVLKLEAMPGWYM